MTVAEHMARLSVRGAVALWRWSREHRTASDTALAVQAKAIAAADAPGRLDIRDHRKPLSSAHP